MAVTLQRVLSLGGGSDGPLLGSMVVQSIQPAAAADYGIPLRARQGQNDSQPPIDVAGEVDG